MKGHYQLKLEQKIREGDQKKYRQEGSDHPPEDCDYLVGTRCFLYGAYTFYRKARTEGCPPNWRWADADEDTSMCVANGIGDVLDFGPDIKQPTGIDSCSTLGHPMFVMPWPAPEGDNK